jgi:hypothetical protein
MEISFATEQLKEACLARSAEASSVPTAALSALHVLYNAMRNSEHLQELPYGRPEPGTLNDSLEWTVDLADRYRVRLRVSHLKLLSPEGIPDLSRIRRVQVMAIEGPNG